jgi:hypothetical protein
MANPLAFNRQNKDLILLRLTFGMIIYFLIS